MLAIHLMAASPLPAQIIADFTGGNTTVEVDGYQGKAGDGWTDAWQRRGYVTTGSTTAAIGSIGVVNDGTLWSGNRLKVAPSNNETGNGVSVGRAYDQISAGVDATQPITISFQFSFDDLGSFLSSSSNNIFIGENNGNSGNPTSTTAWFIQGFGGTNPEAAPTGLAYSTSTARQGQWNFGRGFELYEPTGIALEEGVLYTFTLSIYPSTGVGVDSTYTAHLTNGADSYQSGPLGFHSEQELGRMLVFAERYQIGQGATYSLGHISIAQIPEPSRAAFVVMSMAALGVAMFRHRSKGGKSKNEDV